MDLISSAVRTVEPGGQIYIGLKSGMTTQIQCEITHTVHSKELYGLTTTGRSQSPAELVKGHPSFMLAQRTVQSCGGKLALERREDNINTFRIVLPKNALNAPLVEEPIR